MNLPSLLRKVLVPVNMLSNAKRMEITPLFRLTPLPVTAGVLTPKLERSLMDLTPAFQFQIVPNT